MADLLVQCPSCGHHVNVNEAVGRAAQAAAAAEKAGKVADPDIDRENLPPPNAEKPPARDDDNEKEDGDGDEQHGDD